MVDTFITAFGKFLSFMHIQFKKPERFYEWANEKHPVRLQWSLALAYLALFLAMFWHIFIYIG